MAAPQYSYRNVIYEESSTLCSRGRFYNRPMICSARISNVVTAGTLKTYSTRVLLLCRSNVCEWLKGLGTFLHDTQQKLTHAFSNMHPCEDIFCSSPFCSFHYPCTSDFAIDFLTQNVLVERPGL